MWIHRATDGSLGLRFMTDMAVSYFATVTDCEGDRVAKYAGENVHQIVKKQEAFAKEDYVKALQDGFIATDTALQEGVFLLIAYRILTHQTGSTRTSHPVVQLPLF